MTGQQLHDLIRRLMPLSRSITGNGVRETLGVVGEHVPLQQHEVATGTPALDWTVPQEWEVTAAWVDGPGGRRVVDVRDSPLHLVGYSVPISARMTLDELRPHLHTLPHHPDWTPYRTSYYSPAWGFCLPHRVLETLEEGDYDVHVETRLFDGSLTYGELLLPGDQEAEVLVSTHVCHPAMANDNLSGIAVAVGLAQHLMSLPRRRWSYRFVFVPGTIGSLTWLSCNAEAVRRVRAGLVLTGLGDSGNPVWKRSRRGDSWTDRVVEHVLRRSGRPHRVLDFSPYGYDERQYCSPGFDLPVGRLGRGVHGEYPEYHTSADDLSFVSPEALQGSLELLTAVVAVLEQDGAYVNTSPYGEPQLGRRGLYRSIGASMDPKATEMASLWLLNQSDGEHTLLDVAERSGLDVAALAHAASALVEADLLRPLPPA